MESILEKEESLIEHAKSGDSEAFATLLSIHKSKLRNIIRKMVGHPEDTEDIYQETTLKASQSINQYRGDALFSTWLCSIGVNTAMDFLRQQKAWRARAQVIYGNTCYENEELGMEVFNAMHDVAFEYDVYEHIAYCWSCVARSLSPEENAALVYREFFDLKNRESAKRMNMSESVFRHHLASAREKMKTRFDDLCVLVNKQGVCYQCSGLRDGCPEDKQGDPIPESLTGEQRIKIVGDAELDKGKSQVMHDLFYRRTKAIEEDGKGDETRASVCLDK